ncbi:hypothetical protein EN858_33345 [Mesorhizobium sp. M4B.F.Ca.ET.215.01.1.1]|uniref:hypothetical protein n=1 Tax=unclassified Mesorhizobium TaxID=325217 RepID=UPI000FCC8C66|nr:MULTISPECIES: hypothetical protein [unclassified Mesorhizobium]RUW18082.1 hypothetical protein EOA34_32735 [Mesorhizobium sp. M4B.F.Ca.ET.013.02.1.1]RVD33641.1 hypothetical protein EN741_31670 [Mesorhizobium sp. M4B.F.Ca.ET.019.03.1.1]TGQ03940.1 hypothetical protein EN858_33345 [Mesorhizobium sp. M4B.F.Ca.ET.215.01.1.1]TGQ24043.1 hypothetical protein EN863_063945 [Mesorhizobium sp. M00.F.Ca.ET.220.01.1.1]TGQ96618.1 hypothetical protein EN846_33340 [Mesorhizobium sp. M4B.F.Ca.ET.203.01.1.1]
MADSDHSTTLSSVTRRLLMTQIVAVAGMWPFGARAREGRQDDPALRLCDSWHGVHRSTLVLCRQQQQLETYLVKAIGFPSAKMQLPGGGEKTVHSVESLDELYSHENEVEWVRTYSELAAHQARWDATDAEIGFSRTDELIQRSEAAEQALLDDLPLTPACSVEGVLAKLLVILRYGEHWQIQTISPGVISGRCSMTLPATITLIRQPSSLHARKEGIRNAKEALAYRDFAVTAMAWMCSGGPLRRRHRNPPV